jgi:hypothetical protein
MERNRPTAEFVIAFHGIDQMTEERISPHLTIRDDIQTRFELKSDGFIHSTVFDLFELGMTQLPGGAFLARFL